MERIGPYTLGEKLGQGGMGEVYAGVAPSGAKVAVKVLKRALAEHPEVRRRFTREARAAARLEHPHIVSLLDFGSHKGEFYIVMERVTGGSLAGWRAAPPDAESLWQVFDQILRALAYAHARGVVHRDLKPENVLLSFDDEGRPCAKLMDFGVVYFRDEKEMQGEGGVGLIGTPAYMAPEQAMNLADASPATDLYAVGVMLFEFLTGRRPFNAKSTAAAVVAHMNEPVPAVTLQRGYRSEADLDAWLGRFLAKDPTERFLFAADARRALASVRVFGAPRARPVVPGEVETVDETGLGTVVHAIGGIVRAEPEPSSAARLFALRDPAFIGRGASLEGLRRRALETVAARRCGVTLVAGEMGLGKTRLLHHLRERVEEPGAMQAWMGVHDGRPEGPDVGYRQALRRGFGVAGLNPAELRLRVQKQLTRQGADGVWERDALAELMLPREDDTEPLLDTPDATFALVGRALRRAYKDRPVLLLLDDAHLGDGEALRMLRWLLTARTPTSWYAIVTYRPEYARTEGPFADALSALTALDDPRVVQEDLERLDVSTIRTLAERCLPMEPTVAQAIAMRADGNPMIAVELVRHLAESGRMEGLGTAPTADELLGDLPTGVSALVKRRLDEAASASHAPEQTMAVWKRLAFLGLRFDTALAQTLVAHSDYASAFDAAIEVGLLHGLFTGDDPDVLRFESGLVRDALLDAATADGDAQALQRASGDAKAVHYASSLAERSLEIARHFHLGGAPIEAVRFYLDAAHFALQQHRTEAALEALRFVDGLSVAVPDAASVRVRSEVAHAEAHLRAARYEVARQHATSAQAIAASAGLPAPPEAIRLLADIARYEGKMRESRELYGDAMRSFDERGDGRGHAQAEFGLGKLELRDGKLPAAERHLRSARDAFAAMGDDRQLAASVRELAETAAATGLYDEARTLALDARKRAGSVQDRRGAAMCLLTLGEVARTEKSASEAADLFDAARAELAQLGDWHSVALALLGSGATTKDVEGGARVARIAFEEAAKAFLDMGDLHFASITSLHLALLDAESGRWEQAEQGIDAVMMRDREERIDDPHFVAGLIDLARAALFAGREERAQLLLETAAVKLSRIGDQSPIYDRVDEVHYLLSELSESSLDEPTAVVDLFSVDE